LKFVHLNVAWPSPTDQRGSQTSLLNQVQDITFVVMPILLGIFAAHHGNSAALLLTAACMVSSNVAFVALRLRSVVG